VVAGNLILDLIHNHPISNEKKKREYQATLTSIIQVMMIKNNSDSTRRNEFPHNLFQIDRLVEDFANTNQHHSNSLFSRFLKPGNGEFLQDPV
jgi:hypothetical protein